MQSRCDPAESQMILSMLYTYHRRAWKDDPIHALYPPARLPRLVSNTLFQSKLAKVAGKSTLIPVHANS
jgi:hypothetical protein